MAHLHLRLLLALCLIGVGTTFGALALSGYYNPQTPRKQSKVVSNEPTGSQLVRAKPRQRFVAAEPQSATTHTIAQSTTRATVEVMPWAKAKQVVEKSPPREASKPKDKPKDVKEKPPQQQQVQQQLPQKAAAVPWPWNLFSN
jgi:hypothetical protein